MKLSRSLLLLLTAIITSPTLLQAQDNRELRISASKLHGIITVDGKIDELIWQTTEMASNFIQTFPVDSLPAISQTKVAFAFDNDYLYIGGIAYEPVGSRNVVQSLRRDFDPLLNDNIGILLNPYNDLTNGFAFAVSSYGVQLEGLITNGQELSTDWDNKWHSEVTRFADRWEFEMAIPFKTLRYYQGTRHWNINLLRVELKNNERSSWAPVPEGQVMTSFAFAGNLIFEEPLPDPGLNIALIPYVITGTSKDHLSEKDRTSDLDAGFDAKIGVTESLNLDLTVNPDFSQVEVDRQVTDLSRFELFFPERRQFFIENQDLFGEGGFPDSRPFFSRRIGIATDTAGNTKLLPILFGARLSGKIGEDWRIGLLNMTTPREATTRLTGIAPIAGTHELLAQNYTSAVIQKKVFTRSNVGVSFINRQTINYSENSETSTTTAYNRVAGIDYNLFSADGRWEGDFFYHQSFDPKPKADAYAAGGFLGFNSRKLSLGLGATGIGKGYNAELGFVPRKGVFNLATFNSFRFYTPEGAKVNNHGPGFEVTYFADQDFNLTDLVILVNYGIRFENSAALTFGTEYRYEKINEDFDATGGKPLPGGSDYSWNSFIIAFNTDVRKLFSAEGELTLGGFYNGKRFNALGAIYYRYQPYGNIALLIDYNRLEMPEEFKDARYWLIGPRIDLTFTDRLFLTTFVQYNEQQDNININARFQWRYKPVSDIFIVYTDNYFPGDLKVKNRAIVFKFTYWLNL